MLFFLLIWVSVVAQTLPLEYNFLENEHILYRGQSTAPEFYQLSNIAKVELLFAQENYWEQLTENYESEIPIVATLKYNNVLIGEIGVRFRGHSSYLGILYNDKKSFKLEIDYVDEDLLVEGYKNLRFNNGYLDPSFMREVIYGRVASKYIPIAKANYIQLIINGENWGIYVNGQHQDKTFLEEWFPDNDGAFYRAYAEDNVTKSIKWGGNSALKYLGKDTLTYQEYYTLKSGDVENPWQYLVDACYALYQATANNLDNTKKYFDVDAILWFLAIENIFTDDDSYINKGKDDYLIYFNPDDDRLNTLEYDGNSTFQLKYASSSIWYPFKNAAEADFPLLYKLLNIPEYRQRYLAHYRTILDKSLQPELIDSIVDEIDTLISDLVEQDPKKLYSMEMYHKSVAEIKTFVTERRNFLMQNPEIIQQAPVIKSAKQFNSQMLPDVSPSTGEMAIIQAEVVSEDSIKVVNLYYGTGVTGTFNKVKMFDDGVHNDKVSGDGIYGAEISGIKDRTMVRYYIEAVAENSAQSVSYLPSGAEHDVFVYWVKSNLNENGLVINELMADNERTITDEEGKYEDWIELYNTNDFEVSLDSCYLSDDLYELQKWQFPDGIKVPAHAYIIVWADDDIEDGPMHTSFKLSANGEVLILSDRDMNIIDSVNFGEQSADVSYARYPNGTGEFRLQASTFSKSNENLVSVNDVSANISQIEIYPVPARDFVHIKTAGEVDGTELKIFDATGRSMQFERNETKEIDIRSWNPGLYIVLYKNQRQKFLKVD